ELSLLVEATALPNASPWASASALNPYRLYETAALITAQVQIGSVQYNKFRFGGASWQLSAPPEEVVNGPVAMWRLNLRASPANDASEIDFSFLLN
ncbi:MAG TPA: hypothetical protein PK788_14775, partial [Gemmatimonadaceae bacterium]|nr:hypothetical protein [Gemmatimonadaceae bacterium]